MKHMFYLKFKKMKRLFVFVPAIFLVLFLLNSFVLKEKEAKKKPINAKNDRLPRRYPFFAVFMPVGLNLMLIM